MHESDRNSDENNYTSRNSIFSEAPENEMFKVGNPLSIHNIRGANKGLIVKKMLMSNFRRFLSEKYFFGHGFL